MQARAPLMIEHRVIERMIALIRSSLGEIESSQRVDPVFIDTVVDFIRMYADRTHHGKEEDIMFRRLESRKLSEEDRRIMEELIQEHVLGRRKTQSVVDANARYRRGDASALSDITAGLRELVGFYPQHIAKEDKIFFPAARKYVSDAEDRQMLSDFYEFDRRMIHEKYDLLIRELEAG
jgi:hemerythrin-like domain-containing protein